MKTPLEILFDCKQDKVMSVIFSRKIADAMDARAEDYMTRIVALDSDESVCKKVVCETCKGKGCDIINGEPTNQCPRCFALGWVWKSVE